MKISIKITCFLALLTVVTAPVEAQLFGLGSSEKDAERGDRVAQLVEQQIGIYRSAPTTTDYLDRIGQRLAQHCGDRRWTFTFQIIDQAEPNAFAVPGGHIYVSRGLLALAMNETELAGVIGHEIAHVTERHSARQQRKGFLPGLLFVPGNVVGNIVGENIGDLINSPVDTLGGAWLSKYSRGQESDADRIGMRTAGRAGYDPGAIARILARMERETQSVTADQRKFSIFDSHPMTGRRVRDIEKNLKRVRVTPQPTIVSDLKAFYAKLDGIWWGSNPEHGVFDGNQFIHADMAFTITFPIDWAHQNTPQYVLSVHPNKEAMLMLGVAGEASDPTVKGRQFIERMRREARAEPLNTRETQLGSYPAFVTTYLDGNRRSETYLHFAWISMEGVNFQLIGMGAERHREILRDAAQTLRPTTTTERETVTGTRLRIAEAKTGESLDELSARTGNVWSPTYTALANDLNSEAKLDGGQRIKIAITERLFPN